MQAYTAGNEPYELYEQYKGSQNKAAYEAFKTERAACLWEAIEKEIPDIRSRLHVELVGTPLTHERSLAVNYLHLPPPPYLSLFIVLFQV